MSDAKPRFGKPARWGLGLGVVAVVLAVAVVASALRVPDAHSAYRDSTSDLRALREELSAAGYGTGAVAGSPLAVPGAVESGRTLLVVAGVERPFRAAEVDAIEEFVRDGGSLLVADDTGNANELTLRFGIYVSDVPVFDDNFRTNLSLVNVTATLPRSGGEPRAYSPLVMNVPGSLTGPGDDRNVTVIASTAGSAFGDVVPNRERDTGDIKGPFVVGYDAKVGRGRVVVLADPDVLSSALVSDGNLANRQFASDLVDLLLPNGGTVLFDESRHGGPILESLSARALASVVAATRDPIVRWASLLVALAAGAALVALVPGEERLGHHVGRLDTPSSVTLEDPATRIVRAARVTIRQAHGAKVEDDPARLSTDPVLAKVVASENAITPDKDLRDIVQRVRSYGASARQTARGPP